ncbi:MAG: nuclear transport factor 2 family protein [Gammaproteobacteria bacterium]|nr:nuclear transport factor 2 family protein [Gammaproteobacteria bacterium]
MTTPDSPRLVIEEYIAACRAGNVARLRAIFHPQALMTGYLAGQFLCGPPEPFFAAVQSQPAPDKSGADYRAEIVSVEVTGDVATATLREWGYLGLDFTDHFHLVRVEGKWKIASKTFTSH